MAVSDPDWTDPCAVLTWLRPQYYKVTAGLRVVTVRHGDTSTQFDAANIPQLQALMRQLEADCARSQGTTTGRRRAFTAG